MTYAELRTLFEGLLKRRDLTTTMRDAWLQHGLSRAQSLLRVPAMESTFTIDMDESTDGRVPIPSDYLKLKSLMVGEDKLKMRDIGVVKKLRLTTGDPIYFARQGGELLLGPYPEADTEVECEYYAELPALAVDADENWLSIIKPYCIVNGALSRAATHFVDRRQAQFEQDFLTDIAELNDQAAQDELSDAAMSPGFDYPEDNC